MPPCHGTPASHRAFWIFALLTAVCYIDLLALGPYAAVGFYDTLEVEFLHFANQGRLLLEHGFFSWYPNSAGGMPSFVGQHPPYVLPSVVGAFVPLWVFSMIWYLIALFATGWGMFRLLHVFFETSRRVALFCAAISALVFLCGNPQFLLTCTFPIVFLWTHELCLDNQTWPARIGRVVGLIVIFSSSYLVLSLPHFPVFHFFFYLAFGLKKKHPVRNIAAIFMVWTGYVLFFAPSVYSLYEYIPFAQRDWNFELRPLIPMLLDYADNFVGKFRATFFLPVILIGLPLMRKSSMHRRAFMFILIPQMIGVFFLSDTKALLADTFLMKMDLFLTLTATAIPKALFAALTMDALRRNPAAISRYWIGLAFIIMLPIGNEHILIRNVAVFTAALTGVALFRLADGAALKRPGLILAVFCGCLATLLMVNRQNSMSHAPHVLYARGFDNHPELKTLTDENERDPFRVACVDIHPTIAQAYGLDTLGQRGALFNTRYKQYFKEMVRPQLADPKVEQGFDSVWRYLLFTRKQEEGEFRFLLTMDEPARSVTDWNIPLLLGANVRYLLSHKPIKGIEEVADLKFIAEGKGLPGLKADNALTRAYKLPIHVYRLRDAYGKGRLSNSVQIHATREKALASLASMNAREVRDTVVFLDSDVVGRVSVSSAASAEPGSVSLTSYSPDRLAFSGQANGPCYLVVPNNYDPRWSATVNGKASDVLQANNAFQAVFIPEAGPFTAELTFSSPVVGWLHLSTCAGLLLIIGTAFLSDRTEQARNEPVQGEHLVDFTGQRLYPLVGGVVAATVWLVGYYFFVYLKASASTNLMPYIMMVTPVSGIFFSLWAGRLVSKG